MGLLISLGIFRGGKLKKENLIALMTVQTKKGVSLVIGCQHVGFLPFFVRRDSLIEKKVQKSISLA